MRINKIFDISLPISGKTAVYPGDPEVKIETIKGKTSTHSKIIFGSHTATHIDAPKHVFENQKGVDLIDLKKLVGPCRVLDVSKISKAITVADLIKYRVKKGERILLKTKNSEKGFEKFFNDFIHIDGDVADFLAKKGIFLLGIDALSVKEKGGTDLRPHTVLLRKEVVIFEGLNLSKVKPGKYFFIGLPLRFEGLDGSPARAILIR